MVKKQKIFSLFYAREIFLGIVVICAGLFFYYVVLDVIKNDTPRLKEQIESSPKEKYCFKKHPAEITNQLVPNSSSSTNYPQPILNQDCKDPIVLTVDLPCLGVKPGDEMPQMSCGEMHFDTAVQLLYDSQNNKSSE
jgi:hypothetical protein